jgi:hypothetical protein
MDSFLRLESGSGYESDQFKFFRIGTQNTAIRKCWKDNQGRTLEEETGNMLNREARGI